MTFRRKKILIATEDPARAEDLALPLRREFDVGLWPVENAWQISGKVQDEPLDVLILSSEYGGRTGVDIFAELAVHIPETVRILIVSSGSSASPQPALADGIIHQYVVQPVRNGLFAEAIRQMMESLEPASQESTLETAFALPPAIVPVPHDSSTFPEVPASTRLEEEKNEPRDTHFPQDHQGDDLERLKSLYLKLAMERDELRERNQEMMSQNSSLQEELAASLEREERLTKERKQLSERLEAVIRTAISPLPQE